MHAAAIHKAPNEATVSVVAPTSPNKKVHRKSKPKKRIPIAQAVSIGFDCETGSPGEQELAISQVLRHQERVL